MREACNCGKRRLVRWKTRKWRCISIYNSMESACHMMCGSTCYRSGNSKLKMITLNEYVTIIILTCVSKSEEESVEEDGEAVIKVLNEMEPEL